MNYGEPANHAQSLNKTILTGTFLLYQKTRVLCFLRIFWGSCFEERLRWLCLNVSNVGEQARRCDMWRICVTGQSWGVHMLKKEVLYMLRTEAWGYPGSMVTYHITETLHLHVKVWELNERIFVMGNGVVNRHKPSQTEILQRMWGHSFYDCQWL